MRDIEDFHSDFLPASSRHNAPITTETQNRITHCGPLPTRYHSSRLGDCLPPARSMSPGHFDSLPRGSPTCEANRSDPSRTALPRMLRSSMYACALAVGMSLAWRQCQDRISAAVRPASGLSPSAGKMRLSNRLRYSAQVRGLRSRSASHGSAYAASVKLDGLAFSGPGSHLPFLILVCCSACRMGPM